MYLFYQASRLSKYCWDFIRHPQNFVEVFSHPEYYALKEEVHGLYGADVLERIKEMNEEKEEMESESEDSDF